MQSSYSVNIKNLPEKTALQDCLYPLSSLWLPYVMMLILSSLTPPSEARGGLKEISQNLHRRSKNSENQNDDSVLCNSGSEVLFCVNTLNPCNSGLEWTSGTISVTANIPINRCPFPVLGHHPFLVLCILY